MQNLPIMEECPVKILMADDDPDDLELMAQVIEQQFPDVQLSTFPDGKSALKYLYAANDHDLPCLIVLDYNMPDLTGAQVLAQLKDQHRFIDIPRIILSTSDSPRHVQECLINGATEYLVKPSSLHAIHNLAKKLVSFCAPGLV